MAMHLHPVVPVFGSLLAVLSPVAALAADLSAGAPGSGPPWP